jgi:hypothetical protein
MSAIFHSNSRLGEPSEKSYVGCTLGPIGPQFFPSDFGSRFRRLCGNLGEPIAILLFVMLPQRFGLGQYLLILHFNFDPMGSNVVDRGTNLRLSQVK